MSIVNIYELHNEINKKKESRIKSYEKVLDICQNKILTASKKELYKIIFDVPEFIIGLPVYNLNECIRFIIKKLEHKGFFVSYHFPKYLYVSWDLNDIRKQSLDNTTSYMSVQMPRESDKLLLSSQATERMSSSLNKPNKQLEHKSNGKFILNID
jgi:hypothetical protein